MRPSLKAALTAVPSSLRELLLRQLVAAADEDAKFRSGFPTMWGSLANLAQWFSPGGIVDVGANVGAWAEQAAQIFRCPVHLIEAQPSLEPVLRASGFPYTITLLGRESRDATPFFLSGTGSSAMREVTGFSEGEINLPMRRLDDLDLGLPAPLLIKLDVQGYELEVLAGASETLSRTEVILAEASLLEYNEGQPLIHELIEYLAARDFLPYDICGGLRRSSDLALFQTDMIFVRRDSLLRQRRKFWKHEPARPELQPQQTAMRTGVCR
jgi:FkbM family methyltransferase